MEVKHVIEEGFAPGSTVVRSSTTANVNYELSRPVLLAVDNYEDFMKHIKERNEHALREFLLKELGYSEIGHVRETLEHLWMAARSKGKERGWWGMRIKKSLDIIKGENHE